jgi:hypothetical protein
MNDNRFDTVYGQLRNAYALISAHEVLLRLVVVKLQESDPQFAASVRIALDRTLGRMSESRGADLTNNEAHREMVRITIRNILEDVDRPTRLTLGRRLLNWLRRGICFRPRSLGVLLPFDRPSRG